MPSRHPQNDLPPQCVLMIPAAQIAWRTWAALLAAGFVIRLAAAANAPSAANSGTDEGGFVPIFDGRTLEGWHSPDPGWWSVEDGAITGRITPDRPCGTNQYLVWKGGDLADFEIKLKSRLTGSGAINNGFQFRSRVLPDGDVAGYQMDNNLQTDWQVRLYDEFGRHTLAWRGQRTVLDAGGRATSSPLPEGSGPAWFKLEDWHEYHLVCVGPRLTLRVNGRLAAEVEDHDLRRADPQGAFALQLHSGPPTLVQFKDVRLKIIQPARTPPNPSADPRRLQVLESASARWDLGVGGHDPIRPLRYVGSLDDMELNVRAEGPGAVPFTPVALLRGGHFETGNEAVLTGSAMTFYLRVRDPSGQWNGSLLGCGGQDPESRQFRLTGGEGSLAFEVHAEQGAGIVRLPMADLGPGAWHDLVGRYDGAALELFWDGRPAAFRAWNGGSLQTRDAVLVIGAANPGDRSTHPFHGEFEAIAFWPRALTDDEIAHLSRHPRSR